MQFIPSTWFITSQGIEDEEYTSLHEVALCDVAAEDDAEVVNEEFIELIDMLDEEIHPFVKLLMKDKIPLPIAGYEMENSIGEVVAEAEIVWLDNRVALLFEEQHDFDDVFKKQNWKLFSYDEAVSNPIGVLEQIKEHFI